MIGVHKTASLQGAGPSTFPLQFIYLILYPPDLLVLLQQHCEQEYLQGYQMIRLGASHHVFGDVNPLGIFFVYSWLLPSKFPLETIRSYYHSKAHQLISVLSCPDKENARKNSKYKNSSTMVFTPGLAIYTHHFSFNFKPQDT